MRVSATKFPPLRWWPTERDANSDSRYDFIDTLRGVAILLVFLFHSLGTSFGFDQLRWGAGVYRDFGVSNDFLLLLPASLGWSGVAVFFAISGFCIHSSFAKERHPRLSRYIVKRSFRIYPPYLFTLFVVYLFQVSGPGDYRDLAFHILLIHNYVPDCMFSLNPAFWSISVEFQLYILYIVLVIIVENFGWRIALTLCLISEVLVRAIEAHLLLQEGRVPEILLGMPAGYLFSWSVGAAVAHLCRQEAAPFRVRLWQPFVLCLSAVLCNFVKPFSPYSFMLFATATATAMLYAFRQGINFRVPCFSTLGSVSYSVYLIHLPLLMLTVSVFDDDAKPLFLFLVCALTSSPIFCLAKIMHRRIEIPSVKCGHYLLENLTHSLSFRRGGRRTEISRVSVCRGWAVSLGHFGAVRLSANGGSLDTTQSGEEGSRGTPSVVGGPSVGCH